MQRGHNVLVIGAGSIGERHVRCFASTGRGEVGFVEIRAELRSEVGERYSGVRAYESMETGLEAGANVAVIATPAPLHVKLAIKLAERGVHVLIEKPLGVSMEGVERLMEVVERKGVTFG